MYTVIPSVYDRPFFNVGTYAKAFNIGTYVTIKELTDYKKSKKKYCRRFKANGPLTVGVPRHLLLQLIFKLENVKPCNFVLLKSQEKHFRLQNSL